MRARSARRRRTDRRSPRSGGRAPPLLDDDDARRALSGLGEVPRRLGARRGRELDRGAHLAKVPVRGPRLRNVLLNWEDVRPRGTPLRGLLCRGSGPSARLSGVVTDVGRRARTSTPRPTRGGGGSGGWWHPRWPLSQCARSPSWARRAPRSPTASPAPRPRRRAQRGDPGRAGRDRAAHRPVRRAADARPPAAQPDRHAHSSPSPATSSP